VPICFAQAIHLAVDAKCILADRKLGAAVSDYGGAQQEPLDSSADDIDQENR